MDDSIVLYKVDQFRAPKHERTLKWDDEFIGIKWPYVNQLYTMSEKDKNAPNLSDINKDDLF